MTQTTTTNSSADGMVIPFNPKKVPTGQEVFDAIMAHIEPELTSEGRKTLRATYANETPEQTKERKKRYDLAFERYHQAFDGYMATLNTQVARYCRESLEEAETSHRAKEDKALAQYEEYFSQSA